MGNTRGTIHIDRALTDLSLKYSNGVFVADDLFPRVNVVKESDKYFLYGKQNFRDRKTLRADKTDPNYVDSWKIEDAPTYTCEQHELADLVSDRERSNADQPLAPETDCTDNLTDMLMLAREVRVATLVTTTATFSGISHYVGLSGVQQWNNASFDSTSKTNAIEVRIDAGKEAIRASIGRDPNVIVIPSAVARVMKRDSAIRDLIKYTQNTLLVNGDLPPTMFNMKVLIPGGIKDTAEEGQAFSGADIWGKNVFLAYVAPTPKAIKTMTLGMTFQSQARQVKKWRVDEKQSDSIEVAEILVEKIVSAYCGYLIGSAIA